LVTLDAAQDLPSRSARMPHPLSLELLQDPYFPENREIAVIALVALPQPA
jgi:hypothetical protein